MPTLLDVFYGLLETLEDFSEAFGVSVDASYEEIERVCDEIIEESRSNNRIVHYRGSYRGERRRGRSSSGIYPERGNPREQDNYFMNIYRILKTKKACNSCKKFSFPENMSQANGRFFCNDQECLNLYQSRTSAIQAITNQLQQTRVSFQDLFLTGGITFLDLFEIDNCQCEHPGMTLQDYTNHLQNCLKTKQEARSFRKKVLKIIEKAAQDAWNRLIQQHAPDLTQPTLQPNQNPTQTNSLQSNSYPTPPPSPNFTAVSISNNSVNESNSSNSSVTTPNKSTSSYSENSPVNSNTLNIPSSNPSSSPSQASPTTSSPAPTSDITSSEKPNNNLDLPATNSESNLNPEPSQSENNNKTVLPTSPLTKSDKPNPSSESSLTTQKQQIIEQIQAKINQTPNLDLTKFSNWKQTIEQISNIQQLQTYQNSLQQYLQTKNNSLTDSNQSQLAPSKAKTNHSKFIWLILGSLLGIIVLVFWMWKRRKFKN